LVASGHDQPPNETGDDPKDDRADHGRAVELGILQEYPAVVSRLTRARVPYTNGLVRGVTIRLMGRLAAEQAALRRSAGRVARGMPPADVLAAVVEAAGELLAVDYVRMGRFASDGTLAHVAAWGAAGPAVPRTALGGRNLATLVFETRLSARIDDYDDASGPLGEAARDAGGQAAAAAPVPGGGRLWGGVIAGAGGGRGAAAPP